MADDVGSAPPVPWGPSEYRTRVRRLGPVMSMAPPAALGLVAFVSSSGSTSAFRGLFGLLCSLLASPLLVVLGAPLNSGSGLWIPGIVGGAVLWAVIGSVAGQRATRRPASSWPDFWRAWAWLAGAVWAGVLVALLVADLVMGRPIL